MTNSFPNRRVAVFGCGRMGLATLPTVKQALPPCWVPLSHAESVAIHPGLELVGLCDPISDARSQASALYPSLPVYDDPSQLLKDLQPDLVCIATRTPQRPGLIELCLEHNVRLFHLEKPLCNSLAELDHLGEILNSSNSHCTFGALRRYLPPYAHSKKLLDDGFIGNLQEIHVSLGLGRLCWSHIHSIDLISFYSDKYEITDVRAVAAPDSFQSVKFNLDGDPFINYMQFSTNGSCQGLVGMSNGCDLWLHGEEGMIGVLNDGLEITSRKSLSEDSPYFTDLTQHSPHTTTPYMGTAAALDRLYRSDPVSCAEDTEAMLYSQRLLFACVQSILLGGSSVSPFELEAELCISGRSGNLFA